jgi:hypothetical protein
MRGGMTHDYKILENLKGKHHLSELGIDERVILMDFKEIRR